MDAFTTGMSTFNGDPANNLLSPFKARPILLATALALGLIAQPTQAALSFTFNYLNPGQGFDDPTSGADRKAALNSAAGMLGAYFSNYTANLTFDVKSYVGIAGDTTLASAGSDMILEPGTFQRTIVQEKIISNGGNDLNDGNADGAIEWNFYHDWGLSDNPIAPEIDFKSTAIHELLHAFGFSSNVGAGGTGLEGNSPGTADTWATFDQFLISAGTAPLIDSNGIFQSSLVSALTAGTANNPGVLFNGDNAKAANGGNAIPIYSPNPWEDGSSIAHLDDNSTVTSTSIMNAAAHNDGLDTRTLGAIEIGILKDIGYANVSAVPVPAAIWFMGSGLLALFGFSRRGKTA